jgi:hypothetical protein
MQEYHIFQDNVAAATLVQERNTTWRPEKCDWLAVVSKALAEQPLHRLNVRYWKGAMAGMGRRTIA